MLRFRSVLAVTLLGVLLSTGTLITLISYFNARTTAETLSAQVLTQALERIDLRIRSQLDVAVTQSRLNEQLLRRDVLSPAKMDATAEYLLNALSAHESLSFLSFSLDATGDYCQAMRGSDGSLSVGFLRRQKDGRLELSDYAARDGRLLWVHMEPDKGQNDPRGRPFYAAVRAAGKPTWTDTYTFIEKAGKLDLPGVSYATPVYGGDHRLAGVLTADFDLLAISQFLASLKLLAHGFAFVVEYRHDGQVRVIAHPRPEILTHKVQSGGSETVAALEVADERVVAMVRSLPSAFPPSEQGSTHVPFTLGETPYVGSFRALRGDDLRWVVCIVAPEDDILGPVRSNNRTAGLIIALGLGVAVMVALLLGALIARPLRRLADDTDAIGHLELDSRPMVRSRVVEVERLSSAMEEMKRGLRSFRKYVPADLVRELLASGQEACPGGKRMQLTIHFSDIAGFTSLAEEMPPEQLVEVLGKYLAAMTESIVSSGGTVDKYIGDAIMAFWGAPRHDPQHALRACEAALRNRDRLDRLNAEWAAAGCPPLRARAALHTGEVIVGNVGSDTRLDYTVIGDAVNLASRMEGLNKHYGTRLMISEATWQLVRGEMIARPLDRVSVKGKARSVEVYELIGRREEVDAEGCRRAELHGEAFALYLRREWDAAAAILRAQLVRDPEDSPTKVLLERCERFIGGPPPDDWDGTERMTMK